MSAVGFFFVGTVREGGLPETKDRSMSTGLQVGDRVRKIGPVNGADLEQEGRVKRVDEVVKGGRVVGTKVVVECAAGGRVWKLQNATNFARLLEDAAERPTVSQQAVGAAAAPPSRRPPAAPGAAAAVSLTEGPAEAPSDDHQGVVWIVSPNAPAAVPPSDAPPPRRPPHSHTERPMQKQPNAAASAPAPALDLTEYDTTFVASLAYDPKTYVIRGIEYKSGRDRDLQHVPCDRGDTEAWYFKKETPFPPASTGGFTAVTVNSIPRAVGDDRIRWAAVECSVAEWRQRLETWQSKYPKLTHGDGSTCHETASFRQAQTSNPDNIKHCFDKCKRPTWPGHLGAYSKKLLELFRVDPWGNMVCLPATAGGLASNDALCFFDVDHTFPFSRGGRSTRVNFEALQCCANRYIKSDNLVQSLSPVEMQCGISAAQLLAMVQYCEELVRGRRLKDVKHWLNIKDGKIKVWLTSGPGPSRGSFLSFQADVKRSTDGESLVRYFEDREIQDVLARRGGDANAVGAAGGPAPPPEDVPPPSNLRLQVRVCGARVEVWGSATFAVKDELRNELRFHTCAHAHTFTCMHVGIHQRRAHFIRNELILLGHCAWHTGIHTDIYTHARTHRTAPHRTHAYIRTLTFVNTQIHTNTHTHNLLKYSGFTGTLSPEGCAGLERSMGARKLNGCYRACRI